MFTETKSEAPVSMALSPEKTSCSKLDGLKLKDNTKNERNCNFPLYHCGHSEIIYDPTLDYISRYLLEDDIDPNIIEKQEKAALWEIEKPFYDVLGAKYPPSPHVQLYSGPSKVDHRSNTFLSEDQATNKLDESILASEFQRGLEEGLMFLPTIKKLTVDLHASKLSSDSQHTIDTQVVELRPGEEKDFGSRNRSKGKKNSRNANLTSLEGGNCKKSLIYYEEAIRDDMFDKVLLYHGENHETQEVYDLREIMQHKANSLCKQIHDEHLDLNSLLINCSEAVSINNRQVADNLLIQIRKRSSRTGSGTQRLAAILVDGLEARLSSSGNELYRQLVAKGVNSADILKAYHLFNRAEPFCRVAYCFANANILRVIEKASRVHIVDLGIGFGFQWPPLIQSLATRQGDSPKLRITGVDFPQQGFRPAKEVELIGMRLKDYARSFNVPFEYQGIASDWVSIRIEDLNLRDDEVLIVNCMFQFRRVSDETSTLDSPINRVLQLIQQIKPQLFIQGIMNAQYSSLFKVRFKQVLSCYSVMFDIFDSVVPRDSEQRQLMENEIIAPVIVSLIACEGSDWLERPQTYKNWQLRNERAGFEQLSLDPVVVSECEKKLSCGYDKRFFVEKDGKWLLQGWKGRIWNALSTWKPKSELG